MCNNLDLADDCMLGSFSPNPLAAPHQKPEIALGDWGQPLYLILENNQQDTCHTRPGVYASVLSRGDQLKPFQQRIVTLRTRPHAVMALGNM